MKPRSSPRLNPTERTAVVIRLGGVGCRLPSEKGKFCFGWRTMIAGAEKPSFTVAVGGP